MNKDLLWVFLFFFCSWLFLLSAAFLSFYFEDSSSCIPTFGTAHDQGVMRGVRVLVPPFSTPHSVLTSWGTGLNKIQLI